MLPDDGSQLSVFDFLLKIPVIISRYDRVVFWNVEPANSETFCFWPTAIKNEVEFYDLLFLWGIICATIELFEIKDSQFRFSMPEKLLGQVAELKYSQFESSENIQMFFQFEPSDKKIGKANLKNSKIYGAESQKTFIVSRATSDKKEEFSYIDVNSIINKSEELYLENRDLEAAVEVLSLLKNELMLKQKSISKDIKMAKNIQRGIIPQKIPDWNGIQFGIIYLPMQEVSGDYYDYFNIDMESLGILLSDVSGHGIPAAFITAISKLLFTNHKEGSPSEIFGNVNYEILDLIKKQGYLTCFYGQINSNHLMRYALAGHPNPILLRYRTSEISLLEGEGTYLGIFEEAREFYKDYSVQLQPGDKIFVYTDGFLEGQNDKGEEFDLERFKQVILKTKDLDVKKTTDYIKDEYFQFCKGTDQGDDVTLLVFGISQDMDKLEGFIHKAEQLFLQRKYALACQSLHDAYQVFPNDTSILLLLGEYYTKSKNFNQSIRYLTDYNKLKKSNEFSYYLLGYCYYRIKDYMNAQIMLQRAIALKNNNLTAMYHLCKVHIRVNETQKAKKLLEKILAISPYYRPAKILLRKVVRILAESQE